MPKLTGPPVPPEKASNPLEIAIQKAAELKKEAIELRARLKRGHDYMVNTLPHKINQGDTLVAFGFERE